MRSASARFRHIGFSRTICLPAAAASTVTWQWRSLARRSDHVDFVHLEHLAVIVEVMWDAVFFGEVAGVVFRGRGDGEEFGVPATASARPHECWR